MVQNFTGLVTFIKTDNLKAAFGVNLGFVILIQISLIFHITYVCQKFLTKVCILNFV